jgi:hypothetical protein
MWCQWFFQQGKKLLLIKRILPQSGVFLSLWYRTQPEPGFHGRTPSMLSGWATPYPKCGLLNCLHEALGAWRPHPSLLESFLWQVCEGFFLQVDVEDVGILELLLDMIGNRELVTLLQRAYGTVLLTILADGRLRTENI